MSDYQQDHNNNSSFDPSWILIVIAFAIFWPVGVGLLIYKLSQSAKVREAGKDWMSALDEMSQQRRANQTAVPKQNAYTTKQQVKQDVHEVKHQVRQEVRQVKQDIRQEVRDAKRQARQDYRHGDAATPHASSTTRPNGAPVYPDRKSPNRLKRGGFLTVLGGILAVLFAIATCQHFFTLMPALWPAIQNAIVPFICTGVGFGLFAWGRFQNRRGRRLRKLLNMVGQQKRIDIRALAAAFPTSYAKACNDIQELIDEGYLGKRAYINMSTGELILDSDGFEAAPQPKPEESGSLDQDQLLLAEIHRVNDAIPGEEMSRKIDRIEECTQHILEYQKKHPEKSAQLHTFLDYYLPTTLKILNAYAELEQQGLEGENVTATKVRIEAMMDNAVEGFETQLDKLFEGDMLDISADISVMENMLSRDGLSGTMKIPKPAPTPDAASQPYTPTLTLDPTGSGTAVQTAPGEESQD